MAQIDFADTRRKVSEFLDSQYGENYLERLKEALYRDDTTRVIFDLGDLRKHDEPLVRSLLRNPVDVIPPFEEAVRERAREEAANLDAEDRKKAAKVVDERLRIGFTGPFGFHRVTPRELLSTFLNTLVRVEGIVTKASLIAPKLQQSVHFCEATGKYTVRNYADVTSLTALPTGSAYPTKDDAGNPLTTEFGLCRFVNFQTLTVQEAPETAPPGQLPRSVDVLLESDLVDQAKPGDRVSLVGVYRAAPQRATGQVTGVMRAVIVASHVDVLAGQATTIYPTIAEVRAMREFARSKGHRMIDVLAESLAPSIYGHKEVKKALLLQLVGGVGKRLENGTALRGDINVLMVGDPGVAKSQLLRAAMNIAPLAVSTTGRGSSGVGLTAAVTQDRETGERRLEAGAMVLADRGIVCIDEFDKMSEVDRVAIHEVMEQQTVTIAKAGIHTTLNARCSVLAAANPVYGSYDSKMSVPRNVNLPDSLLSRFDLLFILIDLIDPKRDHDIASHVVKMHTLASAYSSARGALDVRDQLAVEEAGRLAVDDGEEMDEQSKFFLAKSTKLTSRNERVLKPSFIRKFVAYVRRRITPTEFTEAAQTLIKDFYAELRSSHRDENSVPITARTLETIIRLATAHAKVRLDNREVTVEDVEAAKEILSYALKGHTQGGKEEEEQGVGESEDEEGPSDGETEEVMPQKKRRRVGGEEAQAVPGSPSQGRRLREEGAGAATTPARTPAARRKGRAAPVQEEGAQEGAAAASQEELLAPAGRPDRSVAVRTLPEIARDALEGALGGLDEVGLSFADFRARVKAFNKDVSDAQMIAFLQNAEQGGRIIFSEGQELNDRQIYLI